MHLSIVIATHNRAESLNRLLASLVAQLRRGPHEVFIADNGTSEPARIAFVDFPLMHLHDPRPGKCRVQNRAIAAAGGSIIACLDDDLTVAPDYVAQTIAFFDQHPEFAAMRGRIRAASDPLLAAGEKAPYLDLPIADDGSEVIEVHGVIGANMAFRAEALRRVGPFDERLGPGAAGHEEETEISQRLRRAGYRIGYAPGALVYHEVDAARADRIRFIRIARERGWCRMLHERHSWFEVITKVGIASVRLGIARTFKAPILRVAREERRMAIALGMYDGLRRARNDGDAIAIIEAEHP